tara:strand:+ start:7372 stop:8508 length:1137 start_codon:yes stop_codon:yes gene_type:complete
MEILYSKGKSMLNSSDFIGVLEKINGEEIDYYGTDLQASTNYKIKLFRSLLSPEQIQKYKKENINIVHNIGESIRLQIGDVVHIKENGFIRVLFRPNSEHNTIFTTDQCNSNCLMCSQPPKNIDDIEYYFNINKHLIDLIPSSTKQLGITGGEPTLLGNLFFELIKQINTSLPETNIHILSNGRKFGWKSYSDKFSNVKKDKIVIGIPLYSDVEELHNYVVQDRNAFYETVQGIQNLERNNIAVEIRVVLHKVTITRIKQLSEFIWNNFPFVDHVAFMGLEYTGYTHHNYDKLKYDIKQYYDTLIYSVDFLHNMGLNISLYNLPLCVIPPTLWNFARKSISDWKKTNNKECLSCSLVNECSGVFATSKYIDYDIRAFK